MLEPAVMAQPENRYVGVRVTPEQYAVVHANCMQADTTISAVLRDLLDGDGWFNPRRAAVTPTTEASA